MAGEMTASEVTRESYPLHFAIADALGGTVQPFDHYQGPYVAIGPDVRSGSGVYALAPRIPGVVRLWIQTEDGFAHTVYNEDNEKLSEPFLLTHDEHDDAHQAISAAVEVTGLPVKSCPVCTPHGQPLPITSLASLKRAINTSGVVIRVTEHWQSQLCGTTRTPKPVRNSGKPGIQTNGYYFDGPDRQGKVREMWCELPKAAELRFNPDGSVTFHPDTDRSWTLAFEQAR